LVSSFLAHLTLLNLSLARHHNLGLRELLVLVALAVQGQLSFGELHEALSIPKSALTGIIDHLHVRGMVERRQDHQDRRRWLISLSQSGQRLARTIQEEETSLLQAAFQGLSEAEQEAFLKATQTLNGVWGAPLAKAYPGAKVSRRVRR